jgi:hypothetical protein
LKEDVSRPRKIKKKIARRTKKQLGYNNEDSDVQLLEALPQK